MGTLELKLVEENYYLRIEKIKQIKSNAYFVKTKDGKEFFLKVSRVDKEHVDFIIKIFSHLKNTSFKSHLIDFQKTIDGGFYFLDENKKVYLLCKWIDGRSADFRNVFDLRRAVSILHHLHLASLSFADKIEGSFYPSYQEVFRKKYLQVIQMKNIIHRKNSLGYFDEMFLNILSKFEDRFVYSINMIKTIENYFRKENRRVLIHHDPAHHNFIFSEKGVYLIDFDYAMVDYSVHDFVNLGVRVLKTNDWDRNIFRIYLKFLHDINISKKLWLQIFWILMYFPQEIWQVGLQYYFEKQPWTEEYFLKRLKGAERIQHGKEMIIKEFSGGCFKWH
ncbi:phosphotransferase [Anaerocellum diazotrophicum]|uniref:Spore coat protein n=1 Tax=Caldicellulosiruptor diazotrophicus TaxID=2806205 RepID=A0ABM7NP68_9FIRM|nr:phosphotransferase [Caldicellulosiruptor diazotrophicus]BCS81951.1 spore coat protein [Caldicellulosiruptor diazotrophicus]